MRRRHVFTPFLRTYLPLEMALSIDFESIYPGKDHFVEEDHRGLYSDCLFYARLTRGAGAPEPDAEEILIYVLIEHQATVDPFITLRMGRYLHNIWHLYLKKHPKVKKIPLIVPLLLYHNKADQAVPLDLRELINAPSHLTDLVWNEPIHLIDLPRIPDKQLRGPSGISVILLAMKHIFDEVFPLDRIMDALSQIEDPEESLTLLEEVIMYLFGARKDFEVRHLQQQAEQWLGTRAAEVVLTVAEKLKKEGKA